MPKCRECNDTGVIETGNNDMPCHCPAGDAAVFNCAGEGQISGAEIKHFNRLPQMPTKRGDRTEYGHRFRWYERPGCWHTTSGLNVMVVPPKAPHEPWLVIVPTTNRAQDFSGHEAEARAFATAERYTHLLKSAA